MNISSTGASQLAQMFTSQSNSSSLSSAQRTLIEDTLAEYDAENLSSSDAKAIVEIFKEAGINPSAALESAMSAEGFDAKEIGTLAGVGKGGGKGPMGPPPPPSEEELSSVEELLESLLSLDDEEEDETSSTSISESTSLDNILDYTDRIVRLKDDAKTDVMEMLSNYNAEDNENFDKYTQESIIDSLRQILNEPDNFKSISFYA